MNIKDEIKKLQQNRLLKNEDEVINFEETIGNLLSLKDAKLIKDLCSGFDDSTNNHEVMFGLIHAIEEFEGEEGLLEMAKAIPDMLPHATDWAIILHYRILNDEPSRKLYAQVLNKVNLKAKSTIVMLLKKIKAEDPTRFETFVDQVLSSTK
ncbi:MAG: hypothetical protein GXY86_11795 [Firmicutes bacterium]|jgi:hypothetical protein|nr:hypothetical protein [Bacillota bacterium]